jgi:MFS transporter, YNFM family, putative membrane transport protein
MTQAATTGRDRASLLIMGLAAFMVQADARVIDPLLHVVAHDFHTTPPDAAIVISSYALPYGLFQLLYGPIGDRIGKLRVMAVCLSLFSIGTFACAFVPSIPVFAILRFLTGVVAAAVIPMSLGYIGDKFPYQGRQIALGRFMSALMMGQIVGSTVGGLFGQYLGWRNVFIALGVAAFVVSILLAREGRRFPEAVNTSAPLTFLTRYAGIARRPGAPLVLGTVLIEGLFVFGGLAYLASSLTDRFAINYAYAGLMVAGFGCGGLIYSGSVKKLVTRIGELGVLILGGALLGVGFVAIGLMPTWHWFIPAVIVVGMGYYTMHGTLQTRATELAPQARGAAISLFAFFFFLGQATGPQLLGAIVDARGYGPAFVAAGVGLFATAFTSRTLFASARQA